MYSCTFSNKTGLPVYLEAWQNIMPGLSQMKEITVLSGETVNMSSEVGEWIIHTYLNAELAKYWEDIGISPGFEIGKFWDKPSYSGEQTYAYRDEFIILFEENIFTLKRKCD